MKKLKFLLFCLSAILLGCQQAELISPEDHGGIAMKTVTISAGMDSDQTKASLDSQTGAFTWQSGDLISVLATDGKFYDFILNEGAGSLNAEFTGNIPETASITTVATYPRIVANGTENTLLSGNTLNYVLPASWTYAANVSNVPMVATFGEGAEDMSFRQVGGVMRFPVKNLPKEASFVVTMNDKTITGQFPVDITAVGETAMTAGDAASVLTISYTSDVDGGSAEFNVPVPVGVYNNFNVTVKDAAGNDLFSKDYSADNKVNRRTLLMMKELVLPERPVVISEVWPFYVDARVIFNKYEGVTTYAFYVDGATEPVIKDVEDWDDMVGALVGGNFGHNTTHTVAVAKVVDGEPVLASKSETVSFTTADIRQLTTNTGTKFVSVGWDDVAIAGGPKFVNGKWTTVAAANYPDLDEKGRKLHQTRGYKVQLLASDKTTVIYEMIPFDGHSIHQNAYYDSATLGKIDGSNILNPTALSFGYLEPGKDYYFRVKTLDGIEDIDFDKGDYIAPDNTGKPYPYPISSARGGSAWSDLVKVSTDAAHVPSANEVLYEGFDDIMVGSDYVNWAAAVNPDMETTKRQGWDKYILDTPAGYPAFLNKPANERKWTTHTFNKFFTAFDLGLYDGEFVGKQPNVLNANAGSLEGWAVKTDKIERNVYPFFGAIAIGQGEKASKYDSHGGSAICTPELNSDILLKNVGTKCTVRVKLSYITQGRSSVARRVHISNTRTPNDKITLDASQIHADEWAEEIGQYHETYDASAFKTTNYLHYQKYFEVECEMYLRKGDVLMFEKTTESDKANREYGLLIIGEIQIEADPTAIEVPTFNDNGVGTEPDDTDYDVYGLGEFPVSHWYTVEPWAYTNPDGTYNDELTRFRYQEMKDAGINTTLYYGHAVNCSIEEQKRLLGICEDLGLKFIGQTQYGGNIDRIPEIKANLASSPAYVGDYISDEPSATAFDHLGAYTKAFLEAMPDKEVYINLFPIYAKESVLGTPTYARHIDEYLDKVPTKSLSYDYYGFVPQGGIGSDYFTNLDLVRSKTLNKRIPYWVITQSGQVGSNRIPTEKEERWNVWSTIALGSKGISYFCYWTPSGGGYDTTPYMIDLEGNKTDFYYIVQRVNADIRTIGKKLLPCHADGAIMTSTRYYPLYDNGGSGRTNYGPIKSVDGNRSILCGCFRDARISENGENYKGYKSLVVSQMPGRTVEAYLTIDSSVSEITVTHIHTTETVQLTNTLDTTVGDITVKFDGAKLTLGLPEGEAALIEF